LRLWPDGIAFREAVKRNGIRALALTLPLVVPAAHYVYFKQHWHPGQYETNSPTLAQAGRILSGWKGAVSLDFLGAGLALALGVVAWKCPPAAARGLLARYRALLMTSSLLLSAGFVVYLPMAMMSGRYTMPAVWGLDLLIGLLLSLLVAVPSIAARRIAWAGVWVGLVLITAANVGRQDKFAARARMLWAAVEYVERTAPPGAGVAWVSGDSQKGELNVEEGIHFQWHLYHRGRPDVHVGLFDAEGNPVTRAELPLLACAPTFRMSGKPGLGGEWVDGKAFEAEYWAGRKRFECLLSLKTGREAAGR
jgi:hypothetical protein